MPQSQLGSRVDGGMSNGQNRDLLYTDFKQMPATELAPSLADRDKVASHYNSRKDVDVQERSDSEILQLRNLDNWVKSVLISLFTCEGSLVLDFGGGKGGDLKKWSAQKISELVLVDGAINSVVDCLERYNGMLEQNIVEFPLTVISCDIFQKRLSDLLEKDIFFDVVSSQFVIHYAFGKEECVRAMLTNVCERLREDGYFIGTIPDSNVLVRKWRNAPENKHDFGNDNRLIATATITTIVHVITSRTADNHQFSIKKIKNKICFKNKINFIVEIMPSLITYYANVYACQYQPKSTPKTYNNSDVSNPFGIRYYFRLHEAVDCPEYLVHFPTLVRIASEEPFNLELELEMNFHEFFVRYHDKFRDLLYRLKVVEQYEPNSGNDRMPSSASSKDKYNIDANQWEVAYLYKVFAFRKRKSSPNETKIYPTRKTPLPKKLDKKDMIVTED
ncbi:hypothetical protein RFI_24761 [Reticulomyxa filosa]|uniref:mRNA cap guanine-N(7) methyltransferase n=1 Tax=Reticulomyxa filosa TaxID=46433 RepID=X6MG07_RETFI|nr:hypothetical protein RFI_24761 [Reticulomyxa filosa]|eukprot:ETO12616.1 hypothetical protein RFI_24761 [Reticulomyxa filosa]